MKTIAIATKAIKSVLVSRKGFPGSENIFLKISITSPKSFTRKNIHAKLTIENVTITLRRFANEKLSEMFFILSPYIIRSITIQAPCIAPHIIKVYAAPCHKPDTVNTIIVLIIQRALLHRLPPNGK